MKQELLKSWTRSWTLEIDYSAELHVLVLTKRHVGSRNEIAEEKPATHAHGSKPLTKHDSSSKLSTSIFTRLCSAIVKVELRRHVHS